MLRVAGPECSEVDDAYETIKRSHLNCLCSTKRQVHLTVGPLDCTGAVDRRITVRGPAMSRSDFAFVCGDPNVLPNAFPVPDNSRIASFETSLRRFVVELPRNSL